MCRWHLTERRGKYTGGQGSHSEAQDNLEKQAGRKPMVFIKSRHKPQHLGQTKHISFQLHYLFTYFYFFLSQQVWKPTQLSYCCVLSRPVVLCSLFLSALLLALLPFFHSVFLILLLFFLLFVCFFRFLFILYLSLFHSSNHGFFWLLPKRVTASIYFLLCSLILQSGSSGLGHLPMLWIYFPVSGLLCILLSNSSFLNECQPSIFHLDSVLILLLSPLLLYKMSAQFLPRKQRTKYKTIFFFFQSGFCFP